MFTDRLTGKPAARRIIATDCRHGDDTSLTRQGFGRYFTDQEGLRPAESKRMIPQPQSDVHKWRPARRTLSEPGAMHFEKREGLKKVEPPPPKVFSIRERRHLRQVASKEEHDDRPVGPKTVYRGNGYRAADQVAQETDIQNEMQRKQRPLDLLSQRNGIYAKSLGDKPYRHPEYENRFHHAGGLIIGSTGIRGNFPKNEARNATSIKIDDAPRKKVLCYEDRQKEKELRDAHNEVANLTKSFAALSGTYFFVQKSSKHCLDVDVSEERTLDMNPVILQPDEGSDSQRWVVTPAGNEEYMIQHRASMQYLDVHENNQGVVTRTDVSTPMRWVMIPYGNWECTIQHKETGRFLDAGEGSAALRPKAVGSSQRWILRTLGAHADDQAVAESWEDYALRPCETAQYEELDSDDEPAPTGASWYAWEVKLDKELRKELAPLTLDVLKERASTEGASKDAVAALDDQEDPKVAAIDLIANLVRAKGGS